MTVASDIERDPTLSPVCELSQVDRLVGYGGKAHHLARMLQLGFPVFNGFVVTDRAFQEFLDTNDLRLPIAELCEGIELSDPVGIQQISQSIKRLVVGAVVPDTLLHQMRTQWHALLPGKTLVVRSSAVGEDSQQASFAGQLDSILDVDSMESLSSALVHCWASYWSERSLFYQRGRGVPLNGMGVLVQEQAKSKYSGVLFTVSPDPTCGGGDSMVLEYCQGLGAALVSGEINPARILVRREDLSRHDLAHLDSIDADANRLGDETVSSLARWGLKLEQLFGGPQDIEWTLDSDNRLFLLQSRAISVPIDSSSGTVVAHERRSVIWSNANVNENFPEPICPLLYSIAREGYYHYFRNLGLAIGLSESRVRAMEDPLQQIIGVHGARMYYNLSSIHACLRMAPYGDRLTESFNSFVGAERVAATDDRPNWRGFGRKRMPQLAEFCRILVTSLWRSLWLSSGVTRFERKVDQFASSTDPDALDEKGLAELRMDFRGFLEIRCRQWVSASLADAAAMLSYGMLKRFLNEQFPNEDLASLHNTLLKGLPDLASNQPVIGLWELSRQIHNTPGLTELFAQRDSRDVLHELRDRDDWMDFRDKFTNYLDQCGFRCSGELMLTVPSFQENPAALLEILQAYALLEGESPADRLLEQERQRQCETQQMLKLLRRKGMLRFLPWPSRATQARLLLIWTQRAIAFRERARLKQALLYSRCRRIVLAIGDHMTRLGVVDESSDIFFLTFREIDDLLAGSSMFPADTGTLVRLRKSAHEVASHLNPPDTFELPEGAYFTAEPPFADVEDGRWNPNEQESDTELRGVGACGGTITAPAAILQDVSEFHLLQEGDVLVTRQTDPGWGPLFFLIRGLVIERGGMLSHGAILAREYGIPTVVAVPDATRKITHGQTLTVNGDRGIVQLSQE